MRTVQEVLDEMADLPEFAEIPLSVGAIGNWGSTPLHVAAVRGDINAGELLIEAGADVNARGEHGYTPLLEAVEQDHFDFVQLLLKRGARSDLRNDNGQMPISVARSLGLTAIIRLLESRGIDVCSEDEGGVCNDRKKE